jgi:hypothetical protein
MKLWRPVGLEEMALIYQSEMRAFPPRLPEQPIFYPVLNEPYASQIARDWNAKQAPFAGYVLEFTVADDFARQFESQTVGAASHKELWVPAEDLAAFNDHIVGPIVVNQAFFGQQFRGQAPSQFGLRDADAIQQIQKLIGTMAYSMFDFGLEISANSTVIFLHFPFWRSASPSLLGVTSAALEECLERIRHVWALTPRPPLAESAAVAA